MNKKRPDSMKFSAGDSSTPQNILKRDYYGAIDGLRTMAAIGIVMMHMAANNPYQITGFLYENIIASFDNFVYLFMTISAFGMCCGYYDMISKNQGSIFLFYRKRIKKILPFFSILVIADLMISPSLPSLYEAFADLTLLFGFLPGPDKIEVIGVGWFLGLIFVFYLCFPFFCFLIETRKKAWFAFGISLLYHFACKNYFHIGRYNILYSGCFFLSGGLIYLYRDKITKLAEKVWSRWIIFAATCIAAVLCYSILTEAMSYLLLSSLLLIYAILSSRCNTNTSAALLENRFTKFFSGISMEIYLSHMMIFRVIEKLGLNKQFGTGWMQYVITVVFVLIGASIFACLVKKLFEVIHSMMKRDPVSGTSV